MCEYCTFEEKIEIVVLMGIEAVARPSLKGACGANNFLALVFYLCCDVL